MQRNDPKKIRESSLNNFHLLTILTVTFSFFISGNLLSLHLHLLLDPRLQNLTHAGYKPWNLRDLQKGHASWLVRWQRLPFELCRFSPGFSVAWLAGWVFFGRRFVFCTLPSLTLCLLSANANVCCLLSCLCVCVRVFTFYLVLLSFA